MQGKYVTIRVKGSSMKPFLREGSRVVLKPFERNKLRVGIIVLAKVKQHMVLHRVVRYNAAYIWLAGDGNLVQRECVSHKDVVATAVKLYNGDAEIRLTQRWRCVLGQIWYLARPVRRVVL